MIRKTSYKDLGERGVFLCRVHHLWICESDFLKVVRSGKVKKQRSDELRERVCGADWHPPCDVTVGLKEEEEEDTC